MPLSPVLRLPFSAQPVSRKTPSITIIATADESTKDETATMPKITEENATETTSAATAETEAEETEDGTTATYPNGMPVVAAPDETTYLG